MKGFWKGESKELEEEYSLFVPKITHKDIVALAKEYNQEASGEVPEGTTDKVLNKLSEFDQQKKAVNDIDRKSVV